jgi:hypothetical protein
MRVWLTRRTDRRCGPAAHAPTCCVRARARACACDWAPTHPRRTVRARSVGGGPRLARLAGVRGCVGVQRGHRRVEHRRGHRLERGMRRPFRPDRKPPQAGRSRRLVGAARAVVRGGTANALSRVSADVWAIECAGVRVCRYSCAYERRHICMYVYIRIFMYMCIYIYMYALYVPI